MRLFAAGWFPLHPTNWKQAGGEGVHWSFTGVGDSAELIQVLSRDILSVHSIIKQHLRFFEKRENQSAMILSTWSCSVINAIPHDDIRKSQHLFKHAMREEEQEALFLDQRHGPNRVDGGACRVGCGRSTREAQLL